MEIVKAFTENNLHTPITICGTRERPLFRASDIGVVLDIPYIHTNIGGFDETEKILLPTKTSGGNQNIVFLTEEGLYTVLFRSKKPIARTFRKWVCQTIRDIRLESMHIVEKENKQLREQLQEKKEETKKVLQFAEISENSPVIYVYNVDHRQPLPDLKIGFTTQNIHKRVKPYTQACKYGRIELVIPFQLYNIRNVESMIHTVLHKFQVKDEVFRLDVEEAKLIILSITNLLKISYICYRIWNKKN